MDSKLYSDAISYVKQFKDIQESRNKNTLKRGLLESCIIQMKTVVLNDQLIFTQPWSLTLSIQYLMNFMTRHK